MASLDHSVEATDSFASAEVEDERVLLHTETGTYYGLNPIGARVLRIVEEMDGVSIRSVVDQLHTDFPEVDHDRLTEDVLEFIDEMEEADLFRVHD